MRPTSGIGRSKWIVGHANHENLTIKVLGYWRWEQCTQCGMSVADVIFETAAGRRGNRRGWLGGAYDTNSNLDEAPAAVAFRASLKQAFRHHAHASGSKLQSHKNKNKTHLICECYHNWVVGRQSSARQAHQ
ncbi:hypothetical protein AcV7_006247 [Taiwanofungus camphoratus]|nr:hypothetical protein AcV7_006247 [Antrodia cinnamomea]